MLKYESKSKEVQLVVERDYKAGEPITAWFGPQPNQRTFLNYGIVDEDNPHDTLALEVRTEIVLLAQLLSQVRHNSFKPNSAGFVSLFLCQQCWISLKKNVGANLVSMQASAQNICCTHCLTERNFPECLLRLFAETIY